MEDRKNKLDTVQALKTARMKRKNSTQSPSARRTKKLKADKDISKASSLESGSNSTETPSTSTTWEGGSKKEEKEDDVTCGQPPLKKVKTETCPQGQPVRFPANASSIKEEVEMNWDIVQVCKASFCHFSSFDSFLSNWDGLGKGWEFLVPFSLLPMVSGGFGHWFLSWVHFFFFFFWSFCHFLGRSRSI